MSAGERWIYAAGFNVPIPVRDATRIDAELADIEYLAGAGARVAVLSHQGSHGDGSALHLDAIADYLSRQLSRPVRYFPENVSPEAVRLSRDQAPGAVTIFGNTRHHAGEQRNDPALARAFARLGDQVAAGGFAKAHRCHASNVGILDYLPGWAASSLLDEISALAGWAGRPLGKISVAAVGGTKPEKSLIGFPSFAANYDLVVPGGLVLNHVLRASGYDVGDSLLGESSERCTAAARNALTSAAVVHVPSRVTIARRCGKTFCGNSKDIDVARGVPSGYGIVDFTLEPWLGQRLASAGAAGARFIMAGTPSLHMAGFRRASSRLLAFAASPAVDALLLGGDTVAELPFAGPTSTGGGSALCFLADSDLPVLRALRRQASQGQR